MNLNIPRRTHAHSSPQVRRARLGIASVLQRGIAGITAEDLKNKRTETTQRRANVREAQIRYVFVSSLLFCSCIFCSPFREGTSSVAHVARGYF
jgi:hypothetical protein